MNAKEEFLRFILEAGSKVNSVVIWQEDWNTDEPTDKWVLKEGWDEEEYATFLNSLNFDYDAGFGTQELFGYIWFDDGSWGDRHVYDGSEYWIHREIPKFQDYC